METIKLYNRYRENNVYFKKVSDEEYILYCENVLYYRPFFDEHKEIVGIDPEGGPLISVGDTIPKTSKKIVSIEQLIEENSKILKFKIIVK